MNHQGAGGERGVADAEDGGVYFLFGEVFGEEIDVFGAFGAAFDGVALGVLAVAGFGESFMEFDGGEGGGAFFAVGSVPGGDEALVHEAFADIVDGGRGIEDLAEEAGFLGVGDRVVVDAVHFAGDFRGDRGRLLLGRRGGTGLFVPLFEQRAGGGVGGEGEGGFGAPFGEKSQAADGFGFIDKDPAADGGRAIEFAAEANGSGCVLFDEEADGVDLEGGAGGSVADGGVGTEGGVDECTPFGAWREEGGGVEEGFDLEDGRLGMGGLFDLLKEGEHQRGDGE